MNLQAMSFPTRTFQTRRLSLGRTAARAFLFGLALLGAAPARAALTSQVDVGAGFSTLRLTSMGHSTNISGGVSTELNYLLKHPQISSAYSLSFHETMLGGNLPFTRLSAGYRWYPRGINGGRLILDQGAEAQIWKPTPYGGLSLGIANVSVEEYNASLIDTSLFFGAELPLTTRLLIQAQLGFNGGSSMGASESRKASYQGVTAMFGIILTDR